MTFLKILKTVVNAPSTKQPLQMLLPTAISAKDHWIIFYGDLGTPPMNVNRTQIIQLMTNLDLNWKRAIPTCKTAKSKVLYYFRHHRTIHHRIYAHVLTDSQTLFASNFLETLCALLGTKRTRAMVYHPQTNKKYEPFRNTKITMLHYKMGEHQREYDINVQP